jgi:hypothetical protein
MDSRSAASWMTLTKLVRSGDPVDGGRRCRTRTPHGARPPCWRRGTTARGVTTNWQFNEWLNRSLADIAMMRTATIHGPIPSGRPVVQHGVRQGRNHHRARVPLVRSRDREGRSLRFWRRLSRRKTIRCATRSREDPSRDESSEMAALGEVPFGVLLRLRRRDAAVRRAGREVLRADR